MKKIVLLLVLACVAAGVSAQTKRYPFYSFTFQQQDQDKARQYDEFDHYYYDYARSFLARKSAFKHLDFVRDFRRNVWGEAGEGDLQEIYEAFDGQWSKLSQEVPLTYRESFVVKEYKNRPETRERMLAKTEKFLEYDDIVYQLLTEKLSTQQAKTYLQKAYELRKGVVTFDEHVADLYAQLRYVLDKTNNYQSLDNMSSEERALVENYLLMPVSVMGKAYTLPLDDYLGQFRSKLSSRQRKNYPTVHYE